MSDVLLELGDERRAGHEPVAEDDDRPDHRAALVVGRGDDRRLGHGGVRDQRRLDFERSDPVPGGDDHVVGPPLEVQVAVVVLPDPVAGAPGAAGGCRRAVEIADEESGIAVRVSQHQLAVFRAQVDAGQRTTHRAGADRLARRIAGQLSGLGLSVAVPDLEAGRVKERADHLRVQRLAGGHKRAQVLERLDFDPFRDHAVLGRCHAKDVDAFGGE